MTPSWAGDVHLGWERLDGAVGARGEGSLCS